MDALRSEDDIEDLGTSDIKLLTLEKCMLDEVTVSRFGLMFN